MINNSNELSLDLIKKQSLLPHNATDLEYALEYALKRDSAISAAVQALNNFDQNPPDSFLPFLAWEYGLLEVMPYISNDYRQVILEGKQWQDERATEIGVRRALAWINVLPLIYEEGKKHNWRTLQLNTGKILNDDEIKSTINLVRLSARATSELKRLYYGCDRRRLLLDSKNTNNQLWDNYSGVRKFGIHLSFCRSIKNLVKTTAPLNFLSLASRYHAFKIPKIFGFNVWDQHFYLDQKKRMKAGTSFTRVQSYQVDAVKRLIAIYRKKIAQSTFAFDSNNKADQSAVLWDGGIGIKVTGKALKDGKKIDKGAIIKRVPLQKITKLKKRVKAESLNRSQQALVAQAKYTVFGLDLKPWLFLDKKPSKRFVALFNTKHHQHAIAKLSFWGAYWGQGLSAMLSRLHQHLTSDQHTKRTAITYASLRVHAQQSNAITRNAAQSNHTKHHNLSVPKIQFWGAYWGQMDEVRGF